MKAKKKVYKDLWYHKARTNYGTEIVKAAPLTSVFWGGSVVSEEDGAAEIAMDTSNKKYISLYFTSSLPIFRAS